MIFRNDTESLQCPHFLTLKRIHYQTVPLHPPCLSSIVKLLLGISNGTYFNRRSFLNIRSLSTNFFIEYSLIAPFTKNYGFRILLIFLLHHAASRLYCTCHIGTVHILRQSIKTSWIHSRLAAQ